MNQKRPGNTVPTPNYNARRLVAAGLLGAGVLGGAKMIDVVMPRSHTVTVPVHGETWADRQQAADDLRAQGAHIDDLRQLDVMNPGDDKPVNAVSIETHTGPLGRAVDVVLAPTAEAADLATAQQSVAKHAQSQSGGQ